MRDEDVHSTFPTTDTRPHPQSQHRLWCESLSLFETHFFHLTRHCDRERSDPRAGLLRVQVLNLGTRKCALRRAVCHCRGAKCRCQWPPPPRGSDAGLDEHICAATPERLNAKRPGPALARTPVKRGPVGIASNSRVPPGCFLDKEAGAIKTPRTESPPPAVLDPLSGNSKTGRGSFTYM